MPIRHTDGHFGEHEGDGLVVHDGGAEGLPLGGVLGGLLERTLSESDGGGGHGRAGLVEGAHRNLEAGALADQYVLLGNDHILEGDAWKQTEL